MAIKPPGYAPFAVPTLNGWEDPNTGEVLVSRRHTQEQIDEWHGIPTITESKKLDVEITKPKDPLQHSHDDGTKHSHEGGDKEHHHHDDGTMHNHHGGEMPHSHDEENDWWVSDSELKAMSKKELELLGREHGIELDRRRRKADLIKELKKLKRVGV